MAIRAEQLQFVRELYGVRLQLAFRGHVMRRPVARIHLNAGRRDPYPLYEEIRSHGRLSVVQPGELITADHEICSQVLRSRNFGIGQPVRGATDAFHGDTSAAPFSLLQLNPPDHTRLRRLAAADFTPRRIADFAPRIQKVVDQLIKDLPRGRPFDLVSSVAAPLPIAVITDLLGIPDANAEEFAMHGARFGSALGGIRSIKQAEQMAATRRRLEEIFTELFELRRREPGDDIVSRIVATEQSSPDTIRPGEMVPLCTLLLIAGFETTVNLIGNAILALFSVPEQWRLFTQEPHLADKVVEEALRFDPPVQRSGRIAMTDTELLGRPVPKGQLVTTLLAGANRDPEIFDEPNRFDILRPNSEEHLSFSAGIHYCLGAPLARLESAIALRTIATEIPDLQPAGKRVRRQGSLIRGMQHFPVVAARSAKATVI